MDAANLIPKLCQSSIPHQMAMHVIKALGGHFEVGAPASAQGGTHINYFQWEDGTLVTDQKQILSVGALISYCNRHNIFYILCTAPDDPNKTTAYVKDFNIAKDARKTGVSPAGALAAALISLKTRNVIPLNGVSNAVS